ncbi:MAG TPA: glycosyltransferase family 39 protein, partial [Tepidisphaeraceae bacterium]|nr:glycosyltransferase family 39 protein [Tepidisphaeraceae bacterium]
MQSPLRRSAAAAALTAILLGALGLRLYHVDAPSIWFDELFAMTASAGHVGDWYAMPYNRVVQHPLDLTSMRCAAPWSATWNTPDIHPPLYAAILRLWRTFFGDSGAAARSLSIVASVLAIGLLFDAGRTLFGVAPALWACALMATAEYQIVYGQEATSYAVLSALGMGFLAAAARIDKHGLSWRRGMALVICGIGMALTHYYAVGPIAGLGVWGLMRLRRRARVRTIIAAAILGCLTLAIAHGWIEAKIDWIETNAGWMSDHSPGWIERLAFGIADLPAEFLAEPRLPVMGVAALSAVIFFLPFMVARRQPGMLPCGLWLLGAVGVVAGADLLTHSDSVQYVRLSLLGAPAFYLILAGMPLRQAWLRHAIPAAGLLGCIMAIPSAYALPLGTKGDWRSVGRDVASHVRPGDVLVIAAGATDFLTTPR